MVFRNKGIFSRVWFSESSGDLKSHFKQHQRGKPLCCH